jgi:Mg2+/Co2+ transporter CorB
MTHWQITLFGAVLVGCLLLAAFFSFAETSLMAVNRYRLRYKARLRKRYAVRALRLLKRPDRLLGIILIGNTFANMIASSLATLIAVHIWGDTGGLIVAVLLSVVVLIFAEIVPKTISAIYSDQVVRWITYPTQFFLLAFYPVVFLANAFTNGFLRLLGMRVMERPIESLSREELRSIVYDTTGKLSRQYQNMLLGILDLNKLAVDDVMVPQHDIVGIDINTSWEKIIKDIHAFHQDWVPFYKDNINQVVGVLYVHDVLRIVLSKIDFNKEMLNQLLREPYFIPEGTSLSTQLAHFQRHPDKIAFVVDEYGDVVGLLTLNDILEEIVGDFRGSVSDAKRIIEQKDGYLVEGTVTVREFNRATDCHLPTGGARTINGLIVEYLETLPRTGVAVLIARHPIEIMAVKENRVQTAKVFPRLRQEG